jgi:molybdopterin synthase catalytic subunit
VLYFGVLKDVIGHGSTVMEVAEGSSVAELLAMHRGLVAGSVWDSIAVAVNQEYARADCLLQDGDEVALLPPVSGGTEDAMRIEITDAVILSAEIVEGIKAGGDGAVCVFDGIVRDNSRGRKTLHLDYEAYREMALEQMRGLAAEAVTRFGVRDVAVVHRLGRLMVGETSVLIVVASAHRGAAFDACRWLIDTLKKTVPIWKKEQFVDGAVWADGEAFPKDVGLPGALKGAAQWADGEAFPKDIGLLGALKADAQWADGEALPSGIGPGEESGRASHDAHLSAIMPCEDGAPGFVAGSEESGRASHDAHISESRYGAPGSAGSGKLEAGE